eukprot:maker-scaffold_43-snap-gene-0.3-mRNA-1 protein AED:0.00 eAED:0.00 QI:55/1/1/1/1/1/2/33/212
MKLSKRLIHSSRASRSSKNYDWYFRHLEKIENEPTRQAALETVNDIPTRNGHKRPVVFFEFAEKTQSRLQTLGSLEFTIYNDLLPKTCERFLSLINSGYKGKEVNQVLSDKFFSAADKDSFEEYYEPLEDEGFFLRHITGTLSLTNSGVDENSTGFFVVAKESRHLDGRNVAIGQMTKNEETESILKNITNVLAQKGKPVTPIVIANCGVIN